MLDFFYTGMDAPQEAQKMLPLMSGGGRLKHFSQALYKALYLHPEDHHSYNKDFRAMLKYYEGFHNAINITVAHMFIDERSKHRLRAVSELAHTKILMVLIYDKLEYKTEYHELFSEYVRKINRYFSLSLVSSEIEMEYMGLLRQAAEDFILKAEPVAMLQRPAGRLIAWGVLGKRGRWIMTILKNTLLEPDELWDASGDGVQIKRPDPRSLGEDDLVLIIPASEIGDEIRAILSEASCGFVLFDYIVKVCAQAKFPQFYDGSLTFTPEGD
jgi:hypothetical protein